MTDSVSFTMQGLSDYPYCTIILCGYSKYW